MRKLPFLLLGISIAACNSKKNITEHSTANSNQIIKTESSVMMNNLDGLQTLLVDAPQVFTIPAKTIKKIEAKKGLRVTVNTDNLETADGQPVSGDVQVSIKEMVKATDMIENNCPTISDGKILVSDGAYYVGMMSNGKQLQIKKGKSLQMEFPRVSKNGMELFYGERDENGIMNWKPLNKQLASTNEIAPLNNIVKQQDAQTNVGTSLRDNSVPADVLNETRLSLYEDSIKETRRAYIVCHYKTMSQEQIGKVMEAPYKMAYKDYHNYNFLNASFFRPMCNNANIYAYTSYKGTYYVTVNGNDSFSYVRDDFEVIANRNSSSKNYAPDNDNIDVAIDNAPASKKSKDGKANLTVRYYDPVEITNLGWLNCDHFYDAPQGVTPLYTLYIKDSVPANVGVYMIFKDINSMIQQKIVTDGKSSIAVQQQLPLNSKVEFLIYSKVNNRFVQCKELVTVTKNMTLPVVFTPVADDQVRKSFLN
jgi:hypothetical protein